MIYKLDSDAIRPFVLAGRAEFTLESTKTGKRYTYQIERIFEKKKPTDDERWYISVLRGEDNTAGFVYVGWLTKGLQVRLSAKSKFTMDSDIVKAIAFFFERIDNLPDSLNFYPAQKCGRCGRKLTTPESVRRGLGPECATYGPL